jgi:hypothetical protein
MLSIVAQKLTFDLLKMFLACPIKNPKAIDLSFEIFDHASKMITLTVKKLLMKK